MRAHAGGSEKAKANQQDSTYKAVLTTGEESVNRDAMLTALEDTEEKMLDVI